jgi:hypothetical protein
VSWTHLIVLDLGPKLQMVPDEDEVFDARAEAGQHVGL